MAETDNSVRFRPSARRFRRKIAAFAQTEEFFIVRTWRPDRPDSRLANRAQQSGGAADPEQGGHGNGQNQCSGKAFEVAHRHRAISAIDVPRHARNLAIECEGTPSNLIHDILAYFLIFVA
ncbi:hypothetical protein HL653_05135 [Sphingomonas sp. AP4-R1]|uniref:hypothetical protein n=1 Tax=Sphingomonas sp. AP4-R1 TaxID=2735134 RepID=UPI0014938CA3|nr:hypothetical protein [Sphingomonas sp. AP4-R1]QJU57260.1 hypothetical protein HL653_05135 [Sphingomonas sp. AP4-R1]